MHIQVADYFVRFYYSIAHYSSRYEIHSKLVENLDIYLCLTGNTEAQMIGEEFQATRPWILNRGKPWNPELLKLEETL